MSERWRQVSLNNKLIVVFAGITTIATVLYSGFAGWQLYEIHSGAKDTHDLAVAANKQADRMRDFANRMKDQADRTKDLVDQATIQAKSAQVSAESAQSELKQTHDAFILEQWPYMWAYKIELSAPIDSMQPIFVNTTFKNIGRSPAKAVRPYRNCGVIVLNGDENYTRSEIENIFKQAKKGMKPAYQTTPPGEDFFTSTQQRLDVSAEEITLMKNGKREFVAIGGVEYRDVFGRGHETQICRIIGGDNLAVWHYCAIHNDMW